ncbi:MAG: hypothetical protein QMD21_01840 [Candidatus Thermoplasmatota archaeon]|nr:hypothetical protein [Candidatus Thermoplasmatota archaeon]
MNKYLIFAILTVIILCSGCIFRPQQPKTWQSTRGHSHNLYFRIDTEKNNFARGEDVRITLTLVNENIQNVTLYGVCDPAWIIKVISSENQTIDYTPRYALEVITSIEINASSELFITNWTWKQTKYDPMYGTDSTIDEGGEYKLYALWQGNVSDVSVYGWKTIWID